MATDAMTQRLVDVVTPSAGESVTEGTVLEWHIKIGDRIKVDETIVEISTDKVDVELPSPATGVVAEILVEEGETVTVGQVIARIATGGGAEANARDGTGSGSGSGNGAAADTAPPPTDTAPPPTDTAPPAADTAPPPTDTAPPAATGVIDVVTPAAGESDT
ncbi:MAG: biotin/lipoyl-containing protein, partial [Solirubrobacteraceae bacterium]